LSRTTGGARCSPLDSVEPRFSRQGRSNGHRGSEPVAIFVTSSEAVQGTYMTKILFVRHTPVGCWILICIAANEHDNILCG